MPPQNQPDQNIEEQQPAEKQVSKQPETQPVQTPEAAPAPVAPEKPASTENESGRPASETFSDQQTVAPSQPVQVPQVQPQPPQNQPPAPVRPIDPDEEVENTVEPSDKVWVMAVDNVIEKDEGKPFEEEEDSEDLQIKYLKKRYGKDLKKNKDS